MRGTEKWKLGAKDCKNSGSNRGERKDMKDQGKTIGKYIHHHLFLQTVRAGSTSVTRVSLSRKPTFSSVSTLRRRLAGVFGSCCHPPSPCPPIDGFSGFSSRLASGKTIL